MRVIVSGGGSGGHIYPALALIEYIRRIEPDAEFLYVGMKTKMEGKIVEQAGIPFEHIAVKGLRGKFTFQNVQAVSLLGAGIVKARKIIKQFKPDLVIGTGGYVSAPVVFAASRMHIATAVFDADHSPGKANSFLAKYADRVFVSYPEAVEKFPHPHRVVVSGNPRGTSAAYYAQKHPKSAHHRKHITVLGGSLGAQRLNEAMIDLLKVAQTYIYDFTFVTGEQYYQEVFAALPEASHKAEILPYTDDTLGLINNSDLVVSRSGATTLAEIAALHTPAILIPSPNVTNGEQLANAKVFEAKGAAILLADEDLSADTLWQAISKVLDHNEQSIMMTSSMAEMAQPDAAEIIYQTMKKVVASKRK
ncbi:undecaprenyldiphospho-muramoylpentapeptide beta-N-acetylglucosaminyltransferase [Culicoidibacter larvae]|uniref:UDP-N-acetylglucosamine--N-acetylmuramyl-(pentapeptide) pyrophosphoryl-undecaprenol N-acetylglucosamine transferase n=1 Tax=Culicoidibacter larvae TaxID=2579976 RepID=A0A5R8Q939_9FIRM|nr:undecaprenyldiphospho-muramoylpentapeptide beta-N-acetylglucosaminyltransferase [Culicoidibacter larvae]TLG72145.1 undecaprenyldiphospho-muramoylpentapeptide beta-N-acetylglucosaminyltransferase [Culicoidibacter larvae]